MPYTIEDYRRDVAREVISEMTPEEQCEIAKQLLPRARLEGLSPNDRLEGLSDKEIASLEAILKRRRNLKAGPTRKKRGA